MAVETQSGDWLPLIDYAAQRGVSLSTLRRHIKSKKIRYRIENGKYLVYADEPVKGNGHTAEPDTLRHRVDRLELELKMAQEQITEMKMLIALYEERIPDRIES